MIFVTWRTRKPSWRKGYAWQQCVYEGPRGRNLSSAGNPAQHHVDWQTSCEVMAIFVYPRWPSAAVLDFCQSASGAIRSAGLESPGLEPNMEWIGSTVCEIFAFSLYCELWPWNWGSGSSKVDIYTDRKLSINFLLVTNSNFGRILYRFPDIATQRSKNRFLALPSLGPR